MDMRRTSTHQIKSNLMLQARLARRAARRFRQSRRYSLSNAPILFANSFPKSGTHLLTQVLAGFAQFGPAVVSGLPAIVTFEGDSGRQRAEAEITQDLRRLLPGDIAYGHLHALPGIVETLCQLGFAVYFILRDPRDVVVSHVHYVTEIAPAHIHHHYYKYELKNLDERLRVSILGADFHPRTDQSNNNSFPDIRARFEPYLGWLERSEVLALHFEDFITRRGETLENVYTHALWRGFAPSCDKATALRTLDQSIAPERSPTFRSGKIGGWRESFSDAHKTLFKEVSGDLLMRLGYETDQDW